MIALALRLALVVAACITVGGIFWIPFWWAPLLALMVPAALVGSLAFVLALEFIAVKMVGVSSRKGSPPVRVVLRAWWGELWTTCRLITWRIPFLSGQHSQAVTTPTQGTRGVVLVHGYGCNRAVWSAWLTQLDGQKVPYTAVNLEPLFAAIDDHAPCIEAAVLALQRRTGLAPVMVGHSMGGLVARAWWAQDASGLRLHRLVTIGTPHHGTETAKFGWGPSARQMRPHSDWLQRLAAQETDAHSRHTLCFYSACDNMVIPSAAATLPGADNREVIGTGHVALLDHPDVFAAAIRCARGLD